VQASVVECSAIDSPLYARSKPVGTCDDDIMTGRLGNKCLATRRRMFVRGGSDISGVSGVASDGVASKRW
jgi:hypothetical protein